MYGEHLNDGGGGYEDNGGAAPAAFAHQDNYDIEMDRYRAQSQINSHSHGVVGAGGAPNQNGFNDAVYLGDDDANSVDDVQSLELDNNKNVPNMGNHAYYRSASVRDVESPRDNWAANPNAPKPNEGLNCLWVIIAICIIGAIACATTIDQSMINIFIDMDQEGTFIWNLGWADAKFVWLDDATTDALSYGSASSAELRFPIPNTMLYMKNAGYLLMGTILITLICMAYILMILCSRCNSHILLYINCCCCRIPQRASVYFAFDIIKTFSWATTMYYIVLGIYGLLETNFYLTGACPGGNTCWSYIIPHYGFFALMCITFSISCCAFSKVQALDVKFNLKAMQLYYPENLRKAESRNCSLKLDMLFSCIAAIKNICILSFIMFVAFRDVGLISIVFYNKSDSNNTNAVMFFQFQGLVNSQGIAENSCLKEDVCSNLSSDNILGTTLAPDGSGSDIIGADLSDKAAGFELITQFLDYWICLIFIANLFVFLPYIWFVILRYSSIGCCKFMVVLVTFIEWLVYTILLILYYYEYYAFFHNYAKSQLEFEMEDITSSTYNIQWFPDWGIFVAMILWFYLLRLIYAAFKAM